MSKKLPFPWWLKHANRVVISAQLTGAGHWTCPMIRRHLHRLRHNVPCLDLIIQVLKVHSLSRDVLNEIGSLDGRIMLTYTVNMDERLFVHIQQSYYYRSALQAGGAVIPVSKR